MANRRDFLRLAGVSTGSALLTATASDPATAAIVSPATASLRAYLQTHASPTFSLPPDARSIPSITWAGPLSTFTTATSLPGGIVIPISDPRIGRPIAHLNSASLPGNPTLGGVPCLGVNRPYTCKGVARGVGSVRMYRIRTDAQVFELGGVVSDWGHTAQTLIVDGELVPPKVLSSGRGLGGWNSGSIRVAFGSSKLRDIWVQTEMFVAFLKLGASDTLVAAEDALEPQITVVGDSYQQANSLAFGNGGGIALEIATRLGIRKVATDAVGGTGFWNSGGGIGNLGDRVVGHSRDNSSIYLIMAGLNDYGDMSPTRTMSWPSRATFEQAVLSYLQRLRAAQPSALIVLTSPFCPVPPMSDSSHVANPATNTSGMGDFLYMADLYKRSIQQIAEPWVYIDTLMGGGWLNSSGASGDARGLQWFTGGTPGYGTSPTYKPGNTLGGGGGGFGGIAGVPILAGGRYTQAPEVIVRGGTGSGLMLATSINQDGSLARTMMIQCGKGYSSGSGLPTLTLDTTFQITAGRLGQPTLIAGINPDGAYPLPSFLPPGVGDLNNIYRMMMQDKTHPSPLGVDYLSTRLAFNIFNAVMAL